MITVDVNGELLTSSYDEAVKQDSRTFMAKILMNGTELDGAIKRIEIAKGSCGDGSEFNVGGVIGYSMTAQLLGLTDVVKGQILEVQIGLLTDAVHETYTWVKMGEFIVSEAKKAIYTTNITAHGRLVALSGRLLDPIQTIITDDGDTITVSQGKLTGYPPQISSQSLAALAIKIAYRMACSVSFDSEIDTSLTIDQPLTGMTIYQVMQTMAAVIGGYVTDTPDGDIKFHRFSNTKTLEATAGQMKKLPDMYESDFTITGIKCVVTEAANEEDGTLIPAVGFSKGSPVNMTVNNQYANADLFDELTYLIGYSYRPGTIDLSLGDPRLEGDDVVEVTDADGSVYIVPCHQVKHIYDGGFMTTIEAVRATNIENNIGTETPFQQLKKETRVSIAAIRKAVSDIETIAGNTEQHFWMIEEGTDTGAHITEKTQEAFLEDPTQGGGNLLIRSNGLAVRDGLLELATFGSGGVIVGQATQSRQEITYHAMKMIDSDNNEYLHFSDLRNADGVYQETESFTGDGTTTDFRLTWDSITAATATIDGVQTTDFDIVVYDGYCWAQFTTAPASGSTVVVIYDTTSSKLKAYTMGTRASGSIGGYSFAEGYNNIASGRHSYAKGVDCTASGDYSRAGGDASEATADHATAQGNHVKATGSNQTVVGAFNKPDSNKALIIGNGDTVARSNALTVDWDGKIRQQADGTYVADLGSDAIGFINALTAKQYSNGIGFTATDVDAVDPWGFLADGDTLDYISIIAALVAYCQSLETRITALEA